MKQKKCLNIILALYQIKGKFTVKQTICHSNYLLIIWQFNRDSTGVTARLIQFIEIKFPLCVLNIYNCFKKRYETTYDNWHELKDDQINIMYSYVTYACPTQQGWMGGVFFITS
jgi:hypothetical protein